MQGAKARPLVNHVERKETARTPQAAHTLGRRAEEGDGEDDEAATQDHRAAVEEVEGRILTSRS